MSTTKYQQKGIAIVIVLAIMVALVLITTALLGTVTRMRNTAKSYSHNDLAKIAALSGRAAGLNAIKTLVAGKSIYDNSHPWVDADGGTGALTNTILWTDNSPSGSDIADLWEYAHAMQPDIILFSPDKGEYANNTQIAPPFSVVAEKISILKDKSIKKASSGTDYTSASVYSTKQESENHQIDNRIFIRYIPVDYFDQEFVSTSAADAFFQSAYAVNIIDLGACICTNVDPNINDGLGGVYKNIENNATPSYISISNQTFTFRDIAATRANKDFNKEASSLMQFTPFGQTFDGGGKNYPLVNFRSASPQLIKAMIEGFENVVGNIADFDNTGFNKIKAVSNDIKEEFTTNRDGTLTAIAEEVRKDIENAIDGSNAAELKTGFLVLYSLFGWDIVKTMSLDGAAITATYANEAAVLAGLQLNSNTVYTITGRFTDSRGPYYRIIIRGVLFNLAKAELVSSSNLEFVVTEDANNDGTTGDYGIIYQKWFNNE